MLFANYNECRIMVTVTAYESSSGERPERIAFVLALLCHHERALEYNSVEPFFSDRLYPQALFRIRKIVVHKNKVIDAPLPAVCQRAVSGLVH